MTVEDSLGDVGTMVGKGVVITGATDGIGHVAARALVRAGARVMLIARDERRAEAVCRSLNEVGPAAAAEYVICDMGELSQVRHAAAQILRRCARVDVLLNNAGCYLSRQVLTREGLERVFATNHLGPLCLTLSLTDRLLAAPQPRVVFTSSHAHRYAPPQLTDLQLQRGWSGARAYAQSKLTNLLTARVLHERLGDRGLRVSSFHPGAVRTGIWRKAGLLGTLVGLVGRPFFVSAEEGADTLIWLAASPEASEPRGQYFFQRRARRVAPFATGEAAERLWQSSCELLGIAPDAFGAGVRSRGQGGR